MKPFVILRPYNKAPAQPPVRLETLTDALMDELEAHSNTLLAFDFETWGLQPYHPDFAVRSVSVHNDHLSLAIDLGRVTYPLVDPLVTRLFTWLADCHLVAHNWFFDGAVIYRMLGRYPANFSCTRVLYKMLASEGWMGQTWGLKDAMGDLLRWDVNTHELDAWLKTNKKKKSQMSDAPWDILGRYNQLDSAATWELIKLFSSTVEEFADSWGPFFKDYMRDQYAEYSDLHQANHTGIDIDLVELEAYREATQSRIDQYLEAFLSSPTVRPHVEEFNRTVLDELTRREPERYTKTGSEAKRWTTWKQRLEDASTLNHFNTDSNAHLVWLFYTKMGKKVDKTTESGQASVNKATLKTLGPEAATLLKYRSERDVMKFLVSLKANTIDGKYRPSYKVPGPVTSRLSCGVDE